MQRVLLPDTRKYNSDPYREDKMKIFVWEGVLSDYTDGMAVAYAETLEDALGKFDDYIADQLGAPTTVIDCDTDKNAFTAYVYGGG